MLNTASPIPLYRQLASILRDRIESGRYPSGMRIPSEHELARQYAIGRPTVRQATEALVREGWLVRRRGAGTFVEAPRRGVDLSSLAGTTASFLEAGQPIEMHYLAPTELHSVPGDDASSPFRGGLALRIARLGRCEGAPVLLEEIQLDPELFAGLPRIELRGASLARIVAETYGLVPSGGQQRLRVALADAACTEALELETGAPVLLIERIVDFEDQPRAIFARLWCRTDQFVFTQPLAPPAGVEPVRSAAGGAETSPLAVASVGGASDGGASGGVASGGVASAGVAPGAVEPCGAQPSGGRAKEV